MQQYLGNVKKSIIPGLLIGIMSVLGFVIKKYHELVVTPGIVVAFVGVCIACIMVVGALYLLFDTRKPLTGTPLPNKLIKSSGIYFLLAFALILILWLPALLALYPGLYTYDAPWQYWMYIDNKISMQQPVVNTCLNGFIISKLYDMTGEFNKGVLVCSLVQMLLMAAGSAYILYFFHKEKVGTVFHILAYLFWGLYPPFAIFVLTMTKDSVFAVAVADFVVLNILLIRDKEAFFKSKINALLWVICGLTVLMLRGNAKYAMIVGCPFLLVNLIKSKQKKYIIGTLIIAAVMTALFMVYDGPVTRAIASIETPKGEMLSVPVQQLARTYNYSDMITEDEKAEIEIYFKDPEKLSAYQPMISDTVKGALDEDYLSDHMSDFISLWINEGKRNPKIYIDSFLENTYAFWYLWPEYVIYSDGGIGYTNMKSTYPVEQNPKLKGLFNFLMEFEDGDVVMGNNFISWLFSPAMFFYAFIITFFYAIYRKKGCVVSLVFVLLLWLTFLLGPVAQVRYVIYLMALFPVLITTCFCNFTSK